MPFFLVSFLDPVSLKPLCADPRGVLRLTCDRAVELGLKCVAGVEYEVSEPRLQLGGVAALMRDM